MSELRDQKSTASKTTIAAWVTYDTGNTAFFTGIIGLTFPLWITTVMGGNDATIGFTLAAAMAIVFFMAPVLGTLSDHLGKRMIFLILFTLLSISSTVLIGVGGMALSLVLFVIGVTAIHTADIFYNALLEVVSSRDNRGTIAGIGIGLGYIGSVIAVITTSLFVGPLGYVFVIRVLSVIILILTGPLLIIGRDRPSRARVDKTSPVLLVSFTVQRIVEAARTARNHRAWARFLVARFWYMWATNAAASFAVLYAVQTVGLSESQVRVLLLIGMTTAIPSGVLWGRLVDKHGPFNILKTAVSGWFILLAAAALIPVLGLAASTWSVVAILSGVFVAGLYVAERPFIIGMAPEDRTGEYFALSTMSGRLAAIVGPFSWGFIAVTLGLGQSVAIIWLTACVLLSILLLVRLNVGTTSNEKFE